MGTLLCFLLAWLVAEALFLRELRPMLATARRVSAGDLEARPASRTGAANYGSSAARSTTRWRRSRRPIGIWWRRAKGGEGQPREESVPRDDEPRDPHADERDHQHDRAGARHATLTPRQQQYVSVAHGSARNLLGDHQRHPRLLEDRSGEARARGGALQPPDGARGGHGDVPREGHREARRARSPHVPPGRARPARRRRAAFPAGAHEPRRQRVQVHARGRGRA